MASSPLQRLCVTDVSTKCRGLEGLRKDLCMDAWKVEASACPQAVNVTHRLCVQAIDSLEKGSAVCQVAGSALSPLVTNLSQTLKVPELQSEFRTQWPLWCQDMQGLIQNKVGDGERACSFIEGKLADMVLKK
jgi:hypothetical protein